VDEGLGGPLKASILKFEASHPRLAGVINDVVDKLSAMGSDATRAAAATDSTDADLRIICPNGHLGFAPLRTESFQLGVAAAPDYIAADSGSDDVGPVPLGSDTSTSPLAWQRHDLEQMLLASRKLGVPMIIGSAGDTGSNSRVDLYVGIIRELPRSMA
jgi:hypothetical protein